MKNTVEAVEIVGEVEGRTCVIIDDMIDTGGTLCAAAEQLKERGANEIYALATHGVLSRPGHRPLQELGDQQGRRHQHAAAALGEADRQDRELSIAKILAEAIDAVFEDNSVGEIFGGANQN